MFVTGVGINLQKGDNTGEFQVIWLTGRNHKWSIRQFCFEYLINWMAYIFPEVTTELREHDTETTKKI